MLAATPGMTSIALTAALLTSHRQMPKIIQQPDEREDVIAEILSLKWLRQMQRGAGCSTS
jgi:hypothetical protein